MEYDLTIKVDDSALRAALSKLDIEIDSSGNAVQLAESLAQLVSIDVDGSVAAGTGELWIVLKPSERLLELVAAARTLEV